MNYFKLIRNEFKANGAIFTWQNMNLADELAMLFPVPAISYMFFHFFIIYN